MRNIRDRLVAAVVAGILAFAIVWGFALLMNSQLGRIVAVLFAGVAALAIFSDDYFDSY